MAGVVLTATNDGGAQWGTRYLLVAAPPLLLLAARAATDAPGAGRVARLPRLAALAVILLAGATTSRSRVPRAARRQAQLRRAGVGHRLGHATWRRDRATNAWWLDQVAAALHGTRMFLLVPDAAAAAPRARRAARRAHRRRDAGVVGDGRRAIPLSSAALDGTCFRATATRDVALRGLRLTSARCAAE